jgi:hypothetical protein
MATSTNVAAPTALSSLDIGTRATTSPELLTSILYSPSFCDVTPSTMFLLPLRGDVCALVYFGFPPVRPFATFQLFTTLPLRLRGDVRVIGSLASKVVGSLASKVPWLPSLDSYIYSLERLNNTSIIFRQSPPILLHYG